MIPILYDKTETAFTTNGLGRLSDCVRCVITEQRNGVYECEFDYPIDGVHFDDIAIGRIIACTHDDYGDIQPFDIYAKSEPINGLVTFNAHHISYRLNEITVKPFSASSCAAALANIDSYSVSTNPFTFWTDKTTTADYLSDVPRLARNMLGGEENSILDVFGTGEYEFDKFTVKFHASRGTATDVSIRYGKNLVSFENDYDASDEYTAVVPYWKGSVSEDGTTYDVVETLPEWYISSGNTGDSGREIYAPLDLSSEFQEPPAENDLRAAATSRLNASNGWLPNQTVKVDFVQLWQTDEYKNYAPLQRVRLCDTVGVFVPMYNMSLRAKVIEVQYNVLLDRYDSMTLGDKPTSYAATISKQFDSKVAGIIDGFSALSSSISGVEQALVDLQDDLEEQIDAKIETWAQTSNPASSWTTSELRAQHNNDLWLYTGTSNITVGSVTIKPQGVYQYNGTNNTWVAYSSTSSNLFDLVDGKSTIFYGSPTGTYANKRTGDYLVDASTGKTYRWSGSAWVVQTDYETAIANATATIQDDIDEAIENATNLIRGGTGGYVVTNVNADGQPIELCVTDNLDLNQAQNIWRWNLGGLGHSSNGYNGTYDTAMTQDGKINADFITTGTMTANRIQGGTLTLGGLNDAYGVLEIKNSSGTTIGTWDKTGITAIGTVTTETSSQYMSLTGGGIIGGKISGNTKTQQGMISPNHVYSGAYGFLLQCTSGFICLATDSAIYCTGKSGSGTAYATISSSSTQFKSTSIGLTGASSLAFSVGGHAASGTGQKVIIPASLGSGGVVSSSYTFYVRSGLLCAS